MGCPLTGEIQDECDVAAVSEVESSDDHGDGRRDVELNEFNKCNSNNDSQRLSNSD